MSEIDVYFVLLRSSNVTFEVFIFFRIFCYYIMVYKVYNSLLHQLMLLIVETMQIHGLLFDDTCYIKNWIYLCL